MKKVVAVVGPTNSGKTELAVKLAKQFNGIIISADSRQVYRDIVAGTNKTGRTATWNSHPARIIDDIYQIGLDLTEVGTRFTLADWLEVAGAALEDIWSQGQIPIICGGTGLYVTALLEGYQLADDDASKRLSLENLREDELLALAKQSGLEATANRRRLIRQLERAGSEKPKFTPDFTSVTIMPKVERTLLYARADEWVERVFPVVVQEVVGLLAKKVTAEAIGELGLVYRLAHQVVEGQLTQARAVEQSVTQLHRYIRRQLTWWRHHGQVKVVTSYTEAQQIISKFLAE